MMNKKGRKYDREKWGWKSKDDLSEHCHYSGLPSPLAYSDEVKHPYYDSNKKKKRDEYAAKATLACIVGGIILAIISLFI